MYCYSIYSFRIFYYAAHCSQHTTPYDEGKCRRIFRKLARLIERKQKSWHDTPYWRKHNNITIQIYESEEPFLLNLQFTDII